MIFFLLAINVIYFSFAKSKIPKKIENDKFSVIDIRKFEKSKLITVKGVKGRYNFTSKNDYHLGDYLIISGNVEKYDEVRIPNGINMKNHYFGRGILGKIKIEKIDKIQGYNYLYYIQDKFIDIINNKYLSAFLAIDKPPEESSLNYLGIIHYISLSGMHLYFLVSILKKIMKKYNIDNQDIIIIGIFVLFYFISNYKQSILRLLLYFILSYLNRRFDLKIDTFSLLGITFLIMILIFPFNLFSTSFLIMYILACSIHLLSPLYDEKRWFLKQIIISLIVSIILIPFTSKLNLIAIIFSPLFYIIIVCIIFPVSLTMAFFPQFDLSIVMNLFENFIQHLVERNITFNIILPKINGILVILYFVFAILILYVSYKKKLIFFILMILIIFMPTIKRKIDSPSLYFLDVGQGDSAVYISNKTVIVSDAFNNVGNFLSGMGIRKIDYLLVSHSDLDHSLEVNSLIENFEVSNLVLSKFDNRYKLFKKNLINAQSGLIIKHNEIEIEFFAPVERFKEANNNSLVYKLKYLDNSVLFTGDVEKIAEIKIAEKYQEKLKSDILKVSHHGSITSSSDEIIKYINPKSAVISLGKNNSYGFPNEKVLEKFKHKNIDVYRTDLQHTIIYKNKRFYHAKNLKKGYNSIM